MMATQPNMPEQSTQDMVAKLFDGDLSLAELELLERRLKANPDERILYHRCARLECALAAAHSFPLPRKQTTARQKPRPRSSQALHWGIGISAAAALALVAGQHLLKTNHKPCHATLKICENSEWNIDGKTNRPDSLLSEGSAFRLQHGAAELSLSNGVTVVMEAPATVVLMDDKTLRMDQGRAFFRVPKQARGYTVVTPHQRIVDLGTEFGLDIQNHRNNVECHVFKGQVRVDAPTGTIKGKTYQTGDSAELDGTKELPVAKTEWRTFRQKLPKKVETLLEDNFEHGLSDGENRPMGEFPGWQCRGVGGLFNPDGHTQWYQHPALVDQGPGKGSAISMNGPNLAYFFDSMAGSFARHQLGTIVTGGTYTVSATLGVRMEHPTWNEVFDGYTIRLASGDTVLAEITSNTPPGPWNSFNTVGFSWHAATLPPGVKPGAPIAISIAPNRASGKLVGYLDFDHVKVTLTRDTDTN